MASIRVLHFSDLHIGMESYGHLDPSTGINGRVMDFLRRLSKVVDHALENEVDLVIFAGDAYKSRDPNSTYRREFARRIKRLADAGIPVVLLVGNHDLPAVTKRASSIEVFRTLDVPNVLVANREALHRLTTRKGDTIQVATVPYPLRQQLLVREDYRKKTISELDGLVQDLLAQNIEALSQEVDPSLPAILAGHFSVSEAKLGSERSVMLGRDIVVLKSVLLDPAWDYVALGHIHRHQELNRGKHPPIVYSGSLERVDFGEEGEPKGFVVAEISRGHTEWTFHPVAARRFLTVRADVRGETVPMVAVLAAISQQNVTGAVVRLIIRIDAEQEGLIHDAGIRQALRDAYFVAGINREVERSYRLRLGGESPEELPPSELLARYLESKETSAERIEVLTQHAEEIFGAGP